MLLSILAPRAATIYNLQDHSERNWLPAYALTIQIVVTFLVWVRLISRFSTNGRPGFDDVLIFLAWILGTAVTAACILCESTPWASLWVYNELTGSQRSIALDSINTYGVFRSKTGGKADWYVDSKVKMCSLLTLSRFPTSSRCFSSGLHASLKYQSSCSIDALSQVHTVGDSNGQYGPQWALSLHTRLALLLYCLRHAGLSRLFGDNTIHHGSPHIQISTALALRLPHKSLS
jgi:hypothetical protein